MQEKGNRLQMSVRVRPRQQNMVGWPSGLGVALQKQLGWFNSNSDLKMPV